MATIRLPYKLQFVVTKITDFSKRRPHPYTIYLKISFPKAILYQYFYYICSGFRQLPHISYVHAREYESNVPNPVRPSHRPSRSHRRIPCVQR